MYHSIIILTILILSPKGDALIPQTPFRQFATNCVMNGKDITYRMHDLSNEGKEVLCKVDYRSEPHANPDILVETTEAEAFPGNLGSDWSIIKNDARYLKHYSITKEESLATFNEEGVKTLYKGLDKDEVTKFTEWEQIKEDELII